MYWARNNLHPGGGFSAGMVVAIAVILQYMIGGIEEAVAKAEKLAQDA